MPPPLGPIISAVAVSQSPSRLTSASDTQASLTPGSNTTVSAPPVEGRRSRAVINSPLPFGTMSQAMAESPASLAVEGRWRRAARMAVSPSPGMGSSVSKRKEAGMQMSEQTPRSTSARRRIGLEGS